MTAKMKARNEFAQMFLVKQSAPRLSGPEPVRPPIRPYTPPAYHAVTIAPGIRVIRGMA